MAKQKKEIILSVLFSLIIVLCHAQNTSLFPQSDTFPTTPLDSVIVNAYIRSDTTSFLPDIQGVNIYAGKKTNTIKLDAATTNLAQNITRTAFAQIPGLTMWEMDGAGTQVNIGSRSTDSHRSIEMNMRQNGYNTNSDIFGYPENHYTVPMQAVERIQLVRGSAALQFGPQFGGMMNFIIRNGDSTRPLAVESEQTTGSNNFFNSYNAVGGTKGKLNYYAYYDYRHGDGWRDNAAFNYHAYYMNVKYQFNKKTSVALQFSRMDYVQQIAGGLTDSEFEQNPKQSLRSRNYFEPAINIPAVIFKYDLSANTHLEICSNGLFGQRNSVQFINPPTIADTFNLALRSYNPRQVDRDYYTAFTTEARVLHSYNIGHVRSVLAGGLRYFNETTKRRQKGTGTTGSDFDLSLTRPYATDLLFHTRNYALFAENMFQLGQRFSITPGVRYELIQSNLSGVISDSLPVTYNGHRSFPLFGVGLEFQLNPFVQLYGNASQAYRPFLYANVTPADRIDKIDPNLKDSKGYDIDLGFRGHIKSFSHFDINGYYLFYGDRVGLITAENAAGSNYLLTTNIGNSVARGIEAYVDVSVARLVSLRNGRVDLRVFNSLAYDHARYTSGVLNKAGENVNVSGNRVENTPAWMNKTGLAFQDGNFSMNLQFSYTGKSYNDAFNTIASPNGVTGMIPAYHVWDWSMEWQVTRQFHIAGGMNNLTGEKYFSRRITFYPGPGILPADGRTFYISCGVNM